MGAAATESERSHGKPSEAAPRRLSDGGGGGGGSLDPEKWTNLVRDYASHSFLREAALVYARNVPRQTHHQPILPVLLKAASASRAELFLGRSLHAEAVKSALSRDLLVGTTLVSMYSKAGALGDARRAFDEMPDRNLVTCNALLAGYATAGDMDQALTLFDGMPTWSAVTWATLIRGFAEKGDMAEARKWFEATPPGMRTVVTWTVLVHGYVAAGDIETARELFDMMPVRNAFVWSSMVTGYFKAGDANEAQALFDKIPVRNLVTWNALIAGYAQIGCSEMALEAFHSMLEERIKPDEFTMASLLSACAQLGSLEQAKKVHDFINRKHIRKNHFVMNGLVDMYAKCGDLEYARCIFDSLRWRNTECWNSMISALASHGRSDEALQLFFQMECSEQKPNAITLIAVLGACTHGGFVEEGLRIFNNFHVYGVVAGVEHYGSLVDLLGRAGKLKEPDVKMVSEEINQLHSGLPSSNDSEYIMLSNIMAASESWEQPEHMRRKMALHGIEKTPGCSSLQLDIPIPEWQAYTDTGSRQGQQHGTIISELEK
ncbi:hypothetical protein PR202_gb04018 [Eleusine coracana subsp. coracana]|uniref:Pentatricopeptide repeat-containing protein n=1 Tax=Eleusine coracana subsp. coracana TaxID=191504 RepID=A0AAV5E2S2_ELECO|nr:hypothetical protein PR202_gb04018 [Eleusine coracana subsp. coracana]